MAFENKNLSVIAYANGFTLWHYSTQETLEQVLVDDYFNTQPINNLAATGDIIVITALGGTAIRAIKLMPDHVTLTKLQ